MRHLLVTLLALGLAAAHARPGEPALERPNNDWTAVGGAREGALRDHLRLEFEGGQADAQLVVARTTDPLERYIERWRAGLSGTRHEATTSTGTLGGAACTVLTLRTDGMHVTSWWVARDGTVFGVIAYRQGDAIGDADIEAAIARMRDGVVLPPPAKVDEPQEPAKGNGKAEPAPSPRETIRLPAWRVVLDKPEGLVRETELDASEKANGVVLKLVGARGASRCMIRVYARMSALAGTLAKLRDRRRAFLDDVFRGKPLTDLDLDRAEQPWARHPWRPPLTRRTLRFAVVGKRSIPETWRWWFVDGRNDRQYEVEIWTTGAWDDEIADFLAQVRPVRK